MTEETPHQTQIYLVTPGRIAHQSFPGLLDEILGSVPVAAVRLALDSRDEDTITQAADDIRSVCHAHNVPLVLNEHFRLVQKLGLDGVHLMGTRDVRAARQELGPKAILGTFVGTSRHAGMTAGETGADYVSFGPIAETSLGSGEIAPVELFQWWHEMIEVPCVAETSITLEHARTLSTYADFIALGPEIWDTENTPIETLLSYAANIGLTS